MGVAGRLSRRHRKVRENFAFELDNSGADSDKQSVPFELRFWRRDPAPVRPSALVLEVAGRSVPIQWVRNLRARKYILRARPDGTARVTIPRSGSVQEALRFVRRHTDWLAKQLLKQAERPIGPTPWGQGTKILFRGESVPLGMVKSEAGNLVRCGSIQIVIPHGIVDFRPCLQRELWRMAIPELSTRTLELAAQKGFIVKRVSVRNQRSRWGSCSRRGTISLNWRLIQVPESVRDYIIFHELAHLREMNHSRRYWDVVAELCPNYREAEDYLRKHSSLLR